MTNKFIIYTRKGNIDKLKNMKVKNNKLCLIHNNKKYKFNIEESITSYVKVNEETNEIEIINKEVELKFNNK